MENKANAREDFVYWGEESKTETRPSQIPISGDRFDYLINKYKASEKEGKWVLFHRSDSDLNSKSGHFYICDRESLRCIFDATYWLLRKPSGSNKSIDAVIPQFTVLLESPWSPSKEEYFGVLADLITKEL